MYILYSITATDPMLKLLKVNFLKCQPGATTFKNNDDDVDDAVPYKYITKVLKEPSTNSRLQMTLNDLGHIVIHSYTAYSKCLPCTSDNIIDI